MLHIVISSDEDILSYSKQNKKQGFSAEQLVFLDSETLGIDRMINSLKQMNLFGDEQVYFINNAESIFIEENVGKLNLLKDINVDGFIFILSKDKEVENLTNKTDLLVEKVSKLSLQEKQKFINNILVEFNTSFDSPNTADFFTQIIGENPFRIRNELIKLINLENDNKITMNSVEKMVKSDANVDVFKLTEFLLKKDYKNLIALTDSLIEKKYQIPELLPIISSQLMNIKMMLLAYDSGMSPSRVESELGFSKWQQSINMRMCDNNNIKEINKVLESLFLLDYNIKSGRVSPLYGFKVALLTTNVK